MKTTAVRLYGENDLRLEEFDLPTLGDNEILMRVVSDSVCLSTYKAVVQGTRHKRVPKDVADNPIVVGHEMCGEIVEVGSKLKETWKSGQRAVIQPALNLPDNDYSIGYSFPYFGGNMTYGIVPSVVIERNCILPYTGSFFKGSLVEPISCILRAFKGMYHITQGTYEQVQGVKEGSKIAILGGAGPMGLGAIDIALNCTSPSMVVVTDLNGERLKRAARIFKPEDAEKKGIKLVYVDVSKVSNQVDYLKEISEGGFDDIFVMIPNRSVVEIADAVAGRDCCINFFAGPTDREFSAAVNFYRVHYDSIHILGTGGGSPQDTLDSIRLIEDGTLNPASMITHIGGLDSAANAVFGMANPDGLKKLCYSGIRMPMTAIDDFAKLGEDNELFRVLAEIVDRNNGLWCDEAEAYLLEHAKQI